MTSLAGSFLIAKPVLQDPNFVQTVVLMLRHDAEGAFGVVVNRPARAVDLPFPLFIGGPCSSTVPILLHGQTDWVDSDEPREIAPGVHLGDPEMLRRISDAEETNKPERYRVFAGYSGWGPDQLENELSSGAWIIAKADAELVFDTPIDELWDRLSPPSLPKPSDN